MCKERIYKFSCIKFILEYTRLKLNESDQLSITEITHMLIYLALLGCFLHTYPQTLSFLSLYFGPGLLLQAQVVR